VSAILLLPMNWRLKLARARTKNKTVNGKASNKTTNAAAVTSSTRAPKSSAKSMTFPRVLQRTMAGHAVANHTRISHHTNRHAVRDVVMWTVTLPRTFWSDRTAAPTAV